MGDIKFEKLMAGTIIVLAMLLILWGYLSNSHEEEISKEAMKAGLVQQPLSGGGYVWIKPEDYKPFPISPFDSSRFGP